MKELSIKQIALVVIAFLIYSFESIFSKSASMQPFLSLKYIVFFGCVLLMLGLYAILWQKVLTFMPLHKAFLCKSICIVITLAISYFVFAETLTLNNIIGAAIIISGLVVLSWEK